MPWGNTLRSAFRAMLGAGSDGMNAGLAQACLQLLNEQHDALARRCFPEETAFSPGQRLERLNAQGEAFYGSGKRQAFEPFAQHAHDALGVARRRREGQFEHSGGAAFVFKLQPAGGNTAAARGEPAAHGLHQTLRGEEEARSILDAGGEFDRIAEGLGKAEALPQIGHFAKRLRQQGDKADTEATGKTAAWQAQKITEAARTKTGDAAHLGSLEFKHVERQHSQCIAEIGRLQAARQLATSCFTCRRQPESGTRRGCQGRPGDMPLPGDAVQEADKQRIEAAEEAQRAADFQQERVGQRQRDFGGKTTGPAGKRFEADPFAFGIAFLHGEFGQQRPCVCQAHAGHDATVSRERIAGDDAFAGNDGARRRLLRKDFERQ